MERMPESKDYRRIEAMKEAISFAGEKIADEFNRTDNDWFSCFVSRLTVIYGNLELAHLDELISDEEYEVLKEKYEIAHDKLKKYRKEYPGLGKNLPPEEVREDLIASLDIFKE